MTVSPLAKVGAAARDVIGALDAARGRLLAARRALGWTLTGTTLCISLAILYISVQSTQDGIGTTFLSTSRRGGGGARRRRRGRSS
jgi:hypothetical protein